MIETLRKINFLITKRQRKGLVYLTLLLFIGMVLEVFGLGILIPALTLLVDQQSYENIELLRFIRGLFSNVSHETFLIIFLLSIIVLYFIKTTFLVFLTHKQNRFLSNVSAYISNNLFISYLNQNYSFHLDRNASDLIKNIQVEIKYLHTFLLSIITICIEGGLVTSVILTLIYIEPLGAISIGLFFLTLSITFFQFTKRKLNSWGELRQSLDSEVSRFALEGLGGIKELLILDRTDFFIEKFIDKNYTMARINSNHGTISQMPRFFLELTTILGLVGFIIIMIIQDKEIGTLITTLGVFVAASFRMIPSLNRIIAAFQALKFYYPSVDTFFNELKNYSLLQKKVDFEEKQFSFKSKLEFINVSFSYNNDKNILHNINLSINKGETIGFIGESGSGKSTLVDLMTGLHNPTKGLINIDKDERIIHSKYWKKQIGYVSQSIYLTDDTIANNIALSIPNDKINHKRIEEVIKHVQLENFIKSLKQGINTRTGERGVQLSGGQRQRIGIARALYHNPEILILDEATSSLDTDTEIKVMKSISKLKGKKTIIIIAHRHSTLKDCDKIFMIENGRVKTIKTEGIL
jgi:ATP-binding cassette, subfamily B, bacterial PglK